MSGFEAWAASIHGTEIIAACMLALGMILGALIATHPRGLSRRERRELADRAEERAAGRWTALLREPSGPLIREHIRPPGPPGMVITEPLTAVAHEAWLAHEEQALAIVNPSWSGDPITTGEIEAITPRMERFLEELFAVPYSADELWDRQ